MKIIITLLAVLMLDFPFSGVAQERSLVSIGDDMPPLKLSGLINSQTKEISITELKGKAVILDFGNTSCMPCLQALPSLSQLRDKFNGDLVVIMVSSEKKSNAEAFLKRRPDIKSLGIPIVTQDTLLKKYFPHLSIPHEVWIDKNGKVQGFTDHHSVTEENVRKLIEGKPLGLPVKWDFPYNAKAPIIILNPANISADHKPKIFYHSFFSRNIPGMSRKFLEQTDTVSGITRVLGLNLEIAEIFLLLSQRYYHTTFQKSRIFGDKDIISEVMYDKRYGDAALWNQQNSVSFELTFPINLAKTERNLRMKQQLSWFLNLDMTLKKENVTCWVISLSGETIAYDLRNGQSLENFLMIANERSSQVPFIDEIDLPNALKAKLKFNLKEEDYHDLELLNKKLKGMGLIAKSEIRELEICRFSRR